MSKSRKVKNICKLLKHSLPDDTIIEISRREEKENTVLTQIEHDLLCSIVKNWSDVYSNTGFRPRGLYPISKRIIVDLDYARYPKEDGRYIISVYFSLKY